jgi:transcriptional regulator with XRE-family HTH domain
MDQAKRKRLEAAGWRMGTVAEFFNLSPEESAYLEIRVRLSNALRQRRSSRGVSQTAFAELLGSSQSRVAKMEGHDPSVTIDLLIKALIATGASLGELSRIVGFHEPAPIIMSETKTSEERIGKTPWESIIPTIDATNSNAMRVTLP